MSGVREQIARIDQLCEEALKFVRERHKLTEEPLKLNAEAAKTEREPRIMPWTLAVALAGGIGLGLVQLAAHLLGPWR